MNPTREKAAPRGAAAMFQPATRLDEMADLLADGVDIKQCAVRMGITPDAARRYLARIRNGLGREQAQ